jgi:hypothetical protein
MVVCTGCQVESQDSRCGHDERYCHSCCTTNVSIDTCLNHFRTLGNLAQTARFASGKVMAPVIEFMAAKVTAAAPLPLLSPPPAAPPSPPLPSPVVDPGPAASAFAAMRAELEADRAAAQVERAAVQAQLNTQAASMQQQVAAQTALIQQQTAATQQILAMMATLQTPPLVPTLPASLHQASPAVLPTTSPPHHQAVLGATSLDYNALLDRILRDPGSNAEVRHSAHNAQQNAPQASSSVASWLNPLPEALIPSLPGSERDNTQILTNIITGLKAREVKYTTLAQLDTALGDWVDSVVTGNTWTIKQLNSLTLYRRFVIDTLGKRSPLHSVVKYHTLWTKAVNARKHDMFADDGHIYLSALIEAEIPLGPATSTSSNKVKKTPAASDSTARKEGEAPKKTYVAGSCTHHPESVTHTTAQCKHPK